MTYRLLTLFAYIIALYAPGTHATPPCERGYTCAHALAMHGEQPLYGPEAKHLNWVNPEAPKGGLIKKLGNGTFDSLNPFILKGIAAEGVATVYDTLTGHSNDEAFTVYGLVAERIDLAEDNSHVIFRIRNEAKFHDGTPITADDVVFTFTKLTTEGLPYYRAYYADVKEVSVPDSSTVRFDFKHTNNKELPLILGQLPVLPKHDYVEGGGTREFSKTSLEPPLGSGPYKIDALDAGKWIRYARVDDYWANDLFLNKGLHNIDVIHYDYYRDHTVAFEAFKAGELDIRREFIAKNWATGYAIDAVEKGEIIRETPPNNNPNGMQAFVLNLRKDKFADQRVREAMELAFDFEWSNKNLFFGVYNRSESFFTNSEFASFGLPSEAELALLEPLRDHIPASVFTESYKAPTTTGQGGLRANLKQAARLLKEAGYVVDDANVLRHASTGEALDVEFLLASVSYERVVAPFVKNLKRLGINAFIRTVDPAQYIGRIEQHDFDAVFHTLPQSLSPGNEQLEYWHSSRANQQGARNLAGISNPAVDSLVDAIIGAQSRAELITATRALDRVLLHNHYVVPQFHFRYYRVAHWDRFGKPTTMPKYALGDESWWIDADKAAVLKDRLGR